jgi:hypothetical protein
VSDEKPPENDENEQEKPVWPPSTGGYVREEINQQHSPPPGPETMVPTKPGYAWSFTEWTPEQREKARQLLKDLGGSLSNWDETKRYQRGLPPVEWPEEPYLPPVEGDDRCEPWKMSDELKKGRSLTGYIGSFDILAHLGANHEERRAQVQKWLDEGVIGHERARLMWDELDRQEGE